MERRLEAICAEASAWIDARREHPDPVGPQRSAPSASRSRRCWPSPPCTSTSCAQGTRLRAGLVIETGEPREIHHMATLIGYGAAAINPYLMFESLDELADRGLLPVDLDRRDGRAADRQGDRQGPAEDDLEDGHLDDPVLLRRADLRGGRARAGADRPALHRHRLADRRHRRSTCSRSEALERHARAYPRTGREAAAGRRRASSGAATASSTSGTRTRSRCCSTRSRARRAADLRASSPKLGQRRVGAQGDAARPAEAAATPRRADPARRGRAGGGDRQALLDRRDEPRLDLARGARDARDRDEPPRRKSNTGEGGEDPARFGDRTATAPLGDQADRLGPLRRQRRTTSSTPTSCRSRWRRARSPARAASCPATRSTTTSPGCATRRRASA